MIKKSFNTIFNNKTILIGYAVVILAPLLITMPVNLGFSGYSAMNNSYDMPSSNYWVMYLLTMSITLLTTLAITIFGRSPLLHYIGEVCQGLDTKRLV